jgi:hypothetical protein
MPDRTDLAEELAQLPGVAVQLLQRHTADATGHCRGCQLPQAGLTRWPCTLWLIATTAGKR